MGLLVWLGERMDELVGIISPSTYHRRAQARAQGQAWRAYAAAKKDRHTGSWGSIDRGANDIFASDAAMLRARVRQLVRDFPLMARLVNVSVNLTVGTGIRLQYRLRGHPAARDLNRMVEDAWARFEEDCDSGGRLDFAELQRLARRQEMEVGESLSVLVPTPERRQPLMIQMYEPDWLSGFGARPAGRNAEIINGIEVDKRSGRVLAYWLEDPERWGSPARVPEYYCAHTYKIERPGQLRGISPLVSAVLVARDMGEYIGAEIEGAMMAARYLAKRKVFNPANHANLVTKVADDGSGIRVQEVGRNIIEIFRPGEDLEIITHDRPGARFDDTITTLARYLAVVADVSLELATGDYRGINFSNLKGIRGDLLQHNRPTQRRFARQFCQRIFSRWLDAMHLSGALALPGYWQRRDYYHRAAYWLTPGIESTDRLRDVKSVIEQLRAGLENPMEIIAATGKDPRETLEAIRDFLAMAQEMGVPVTWDKTTVKNNPAALGAN